MCEDAITGFQVAYNLNILKNMIKGVLAYKHIHVNFKRGIKMKNEIFPAAIYTQILVRKLQNLYESAPRMEVTGGAPFETHNGTLLKNLFYYETGSLDSSSRACVDILYMWGLKEVERVCV